MGPPTDRPPLRTRILHSGWLALLLSLAIHTAFVVLIWLVLARQDPGRDQPLLIDACVLAPKTVIHAASAASSSPAPAAPTAAPAVPVASPAAPAPLPWPVEFTSGPLVPIPAPAGNPLIQRTSYSETPEPGPGRGGPVGPGNEVLPGAASQGGASFFEVGGRGRTVVFVIDRSLSMGLSGALAVAKEELLASLRRLPDSVRFQVILYERTPEPLAVAGRYGLLQATPENKQAVAALLRSVRAEGGTNHLAAIQRALEMEPDLVFFVTDAADLTLEQVRAVTAQNNGRTAIHVIELRTQAQPADEEPVSLLARWNRGTYHAVVYQP